MKRMTIVVLLGFVSACGGPATPVPGRGGVGGSGGATTTPAYVDQLCRDFCGNEVEGEDCGVSNCSRFMSSCGSSVQQCYEGCVTEYSERVVGGGEASRLGAEYTRVYSPPNCPEEWVAWMECVANQYECNDLFGDCDDLEPQGQCPYSTAELEQRCAENCDHAYDDCVRSEGLCPAPPEPPMLDCSTLINPPADCDKSCSDDSECTASYCENTLEGMGITCVAHCTANEGCGEDATCNTRGRCVPTI